VSATQPRCSRYGTLVIAPFRQLLGLALLASAAAQLSSACRRTPEEEELAQQATSLQAAPTSAVAPPRVPSPSPPAKSSYDVPIRTDEELRGLLQTTCERGKAESKPVLLDLGAAWCSDCQLLARMEQEEPLKSELSHFVQVSVNLGEDAHEWLRTAFKIHGIARWIVFRPDDCQAAVESWKPLKSRVVEPATGGGGKTNAATLVAWLGDARGVEIRGTQFE
jgi:thiol:disulfide interchange protein